MPPIVVIVEDARWPAIVRAERVFDVPFRGAPVVASKA